MAEDALDGTPSLDEQHLMLQADFAQLLAKKRRNEEAARSIDLELGRVAVKLLEDPGTTLTTLAAKAGVSHTTIKNWTKFAGQIPEPTAQERLAVYRSWEAADYVRQLDGVQILRVVGGFSEVDVLNASELDPRFFDAGQYLHVPHMVWQLDNGEWVGLGDVNVGYGGAGCDTARRALVQAGLAQDVADELVAWRFVDARDLTRPDSWAKQRQWPATPRPLPRIVEGHIIYRRPALSWTYLWGDRMRGHRPAVDPTGLLPSAPPVSGLEAWIDFLDNPLPWAEGERVARVFLDSDTAAAQGFVTVDDFLAHSTRPRSPHLVIEQGPVQLWCELDGLTDEEKRKGRLFDPEVWEILELAGLVSEDMRDIEERETSLVRRLIRTFRGSAGLPDFWDISRDGQQHLQFIPSLGK